MNIAATFDPSATTSGTFKTLLPSGTGKMLITNRSNIDILLQWGSNQTLVTAGDRRLYCVQGVPSVNWQQNGILTGSGAISQVAVETYLNGEPIIETFPSPVGLNQGQIIPYTNATFLTVAQTRTGGNPSVTLAHVAGKTTYLLGFTFSANLPAATTVYEIDLQGLNNPQDVPAFFSTTTTTQGPFLDIRFPHPLPAATPTTDIVLSLPSGIGAGVKASLIAYAYQQ